MPEQIEDELEASGALEVAIVSQRHKEFQPRDSRTLENRALKLKAKSIARESYLNNRRTTCRYNTKNNGLTTQFREPPTPFREAEPRVGCLGIRDLLC